MILRKIPFVNKKNTIPLVVCLWSQPKVVSGYAEKFKMAEPSGYSCSSLSEDDEYSDPLEVAASAGARLSTPEKAIIFRKRKVG